MEALRSLPFLKLLFPLVLGILYADYYLLLVWKTCILFLVASLLISYIFSNWTLLNLGGKPIASFSIHIHIFFWGIFLTTYAKIDRTIETPREKIHVLKQKSHWKRTKNAFQAQFSRPDGQLMKQGDVLFYTKKPIKPASIPGDFIFTSSPIEAIKPSLNPYQFDFKNYAKRMGATSVSYNNGNFMVYKNTKFRIANFISRLHLQILETYDSLPLTKTARSFIKALLLGDKSDLASALKRSFSEAGVIHVLAVSGLHVGIIVLLFNQSLFFLRFIKNRRVRVLIKTLLLLFIIWVFAGISGLSPSILRAAIMFSFLTVGQGLLRHTNIYNSLCLAAFFMLIINPNYLYMVGFQLSFLAVFGIVFFHPLIYKSLYFKTKILRYFWGLIALSISAQLTTFPLTIYYFHQFPSYFILSNLLVIPSVFIILLLSILLLIFSFIEPISELLSLFLNSLISLLIRSIEALNALPFHSFKVLLFTKIELILLFLIIGVSMLFIYKRKSVHLLACLLFACSFFVTRILVKSKEFRSNELIVYSTYGNTVIDLISNDQHILFVDSIALKQKEKTAHLTKALCLYKGIHDSDQKMLILFKDSIREDPLYIMGKQHLLFKNTILCINHSSHSFQKMQHIRNKICLLINSNPKKAMNFTPYSHLVFNHSKHIDLHPFSMGLIPNKKPSRYHSLSRSGAFVLNLD